MTSRFDDAWELLPDFGRIKHLPHKPNTDRDDLVATVEEALAIFGQRAVLVEEKVDGSQVAVNYSGDVPLVRNKNHVLVKGYGRKNTPAKAQYAPLWNWAYERQREFAELDSLVGERVSVYGEWIYAEHTLRYDLAPADFIAYEVYLADRRVFMHPTVARVALEKCGFFLPEYLSWWPELLSYEKLEALTLQPSRWSTRDKREGVMVKVYDDVADTVTRFKMRRADFKPREDFNDTPLRRRVQP